MARTQFCMFSLADHWFGIEVLRVQEVIRYQEVSAVPLAPDVVRGLINLRGQIVTAIDLRRLLGMPLAEHEVDPMNIIVRGNDEAFSLLVDRIGDVLELDDSVAEALPDNFSGVARDLIVQTYKLEDRLVSSIDVDQTIDAVTQSVQSAIHL